MKLFSLLPKRLIHLACNSPGESGGIRGGSAGIRYGRPTASMSWSPAS